MGTRRAPKATRPGLGEAARHNKEAAKRQAALSEQLLRPLRKAELVFNDRRTDDSIFVEGSRALLNWPHAGRRVKVVDPETSQDLMEHAQARTVDPRIDQLTDEIRNAIEAAEVNRLSPG